MRDEDGVRRKERMRLEMGHPQDDRVAIWLSQTNPSLSATCLKMRAVDAAFGLALLVVECQCLEDALASREGSHAVDLASASSLRCVCCRIGCSDATPVASVFGRYRT